MNAEARLLTYAYAKRHGVVLLGLDDAHARVGLRERADPVALLEARRLLDRPLRVESLSEADFEKRLADAYANVDGAAQAEAIDGGSGLDSLIEEIPAAADLLETQDDAPVIRLINGLIAEGARVGASDIHLEPYDSTLRVRMRVDGIMREAATLPSRIAPLLVSRVKVMARLDIAEKRVPQDGRISLSMGARALDVRVSTLPARGGERVVMRLLDKERGALSLPELGMPAGVHSAFENSLRVPHGIVLVTGPTGSGKTTTLYAGLSLLNDGTRNVLTVEDPVEYAVDGIGQTQVNTKVGMTFAAGLRAILRQDPDVVMVGEIRDPETAQIAVQASLTGHLVLSTVHTNDAIGAITRLRDMGVEPFLLASTVRLILAQRLVRRLCPHCRQPDFDDRESATRVLGEGWTGEHWRAVGCAHCNQSGYLGRIGLYEAVAADDALRRLIGANADEPALADVAFANAPRLIDAAREAVVRGETTLEEAFRVTRRTRATMSAFEYAAVDAQGRTQRGAIEANGPREVRELLRQRQLVPIEIQAARANADPPSRWQRFGKRELALFTRQLATLVEATPLEEALRTIGTQSDHRGMRRTVMAVHGLLLEGLRLSDAMGRQGKAFPPLYRAMVAAGESSGALPEILERLSGLLEAERQASGKLLTALAYPAALAITAVGVVLALMAFVVPKVVEQFDSMGRALPWLTRAVIALSEALVNWGLPMLVLVAAGGFALRLALARPKHRLHFDAVLLRTPLVGRLIRDTHAAQMARTLSIMVGSGLPLMEGLQITAPTVHNRVLREATEGMASAIREGGSLSGAMRRAGVFPPTLVYMATSGENSGRLAPMLDRAADYLDREFATYTAVLMSLLEPAIIVVLGGVVALIVLSILLPILQFNSLAFAG